MRFMMIVKASPDSEAGVLPKKELLAAMGTFNEEMANAGVMLAGEGLQASSKGARVTFERGQPMVTQGPFPDPNTLVSGYWLIQVESLVEAIQWARRVPFHEGEIEIRQVFEAADFPQEASSREDALRDKLKRSAARP
jgi:hypothetical protein